jgi:hypothetical protein
VVQVSKEEAKGGDLAAATASKRGGAAAAGAAGDAIQTTVAAVDFAGFGVAPKKGGVFALDKDVFWFAKQSKDRFRWNMLNPFPLLRQVRTRTDLSSRGWAQGTGDSIAQHMVGRFEEEGYVSKALQGRQGVYVRCDKLQSVHES